MSRRQIIGSAIALMAVNAILVLFLFLVPGPTDVPEAPPVLEDKTLPEAISTTSTHDDVRLSAVASTTEVVSSVRAQQDTWYVPIEREGTVYEAMRAHEATGAVSYEGREFPGLGFFLETIDGVKAPVGSNWFLYVNDVLALRGASSEHVEPDDTVYWRLEENTHY